MTIKTLRQRTLLGTVAAGTAAIAVPGLTAAAVEGSPRGRYRIDLHGHALPPDYRESLLEHGYTTIGGYPTPQWSPERAIDDLFRRYPTRFGALAVLPMPDVTASVAEIEYALDELKLDGVVLLSAYDGVYLGHPRFEPVMAALAQRNAFAFVHPAAIPAENKPDLPVPDFLDEFTFDTSRAAAQLMYGGTVTRYPSIRFLLAHAGGTVPYLSYRLGLAGEVGFPGQPATAGISAQIRNFFYDTALSPSRAAMGSVLEVTSLDHVMFGSDWPFSELLFTGSGDPQPQLSETFSSSDRIQLEQTNALRELPRLASRLS